MAATGGIATGAYTVSLDKSIWGHGEEAVGKKYWNQIFSENQEFADATRVRDLPSILQKISLVFGKSVNDSALRLAN